MDELLHTLLECLQAQIELNKARDSYDDYSWDWAYAREIGALDELKTTAEKALNEYIDKRIAKATGQKGD